MTNGFGAMPDYAAQIAPEDRWAIAAYIRALQLSQASSVSSVPAGTQVEELSSIAERLGYPASYAGPWPMPSTAINAEPRRGVIAGVPAQVPNPPSSTPPVAKSTSGATSQAPVRP
jgi:hypothetical protein